MNGREKLRDELNCLAKEYYSPDMCDPNRKTTIKSEIYLLLLSYCKKEFQSDHTVEAGDVIGEFWCEDFQKYQFDQKLFSDYAFERLKKRYIDVRKKNTNYHTKKNKIGEKTVLPHFSQDASYENPEPGEEDDSFTVGDTLSDRYPNEEPEMEQLVWNERLMSFTAAILTMQEYLNGKENNEKRRQYFRMFWSDCASYSIRKERFSVNHEREIFHAMDTAFLDYIYTDVCRSSDTLRMTNLKKWSALYEGGADAPAEQTVNNPTYQAFLLRTYGKTVGFPTISEEKTHFKEYLNRLLSAKKEDQS